MFWQDPSTIQGLRHLCRVGRLMYRWGLIAATDGNLSWRPQEDRFWVTISGVHKGRLKPDDFVAFRRSDLDGQWQALGEATASSEWRLHAAIYEVCPQARWAAHFHPPYGVALSLEYEVQGHIPEDILGEMILAVGRIPVLPYRLPGSTDLADQVRASAPSHRVMILARHGALVWASDPQELSWAIERLHHVTWMLFLIHLLGLQGRRLSASWVQALWQMRQNRGPQTL